MRLILLLCLLATPALAQPQSAESIIDQIKKAPPGSRFTVERVDAQATAPTFDAHGQKVTQDMVAAATSAHVPGGPEATSGGFDQKVTVWGSSFSPTQALLGVVGVLCWLGAAACVWKRWGLPRAPLILFGAGAAFLTASIFPVALIYIAIGLGIVGLAAYLWSERSSSRFKEVARSYIAGVENLPAEARRAAKALIDAQHEGDEQKTVVALKVADKLPVGRDPH